MTPKFVYFDLDDTLLHHEKAEQAALHDVHKHFSIFNGIEPKQLVEIYHKINGQQWLFYSEGKVTKDELQYNRFALTLKDLGLDSRSSEEIGNQYLDYYQQHWQWVDGAERAFQRVRQKYDVGILTNGFAQTQHKKFKQFDLYDQVQELVISENVGVLKPQPGIFDHATKLVGCEPDDIVYVGNSYNSDVIGGTNYGWKVAWFTNGDEPEPEQKQKAELVFSDFDALCEWLNV